MKYFPFLVVFILSACSPASIGLSLLSGASNAAKNQQEMEILLKERQEILRCSDGMSVESMNAIQYNKYSICMLKIEEQKNIKQE